MTAPRLTPRVFIYGDRSPETVAAVMENFVSWEALRLTWDATGETDNLLYQDLYQEGMLAAQRIVQREPHIWAQKLERLTVLHMRSVLRRGRSVFRADHGDRQRSYQPVPLGQAKSNNQVTKSMPIEQELELLIRALAWSRKGADFEAEHQAILMLRRLARSIEDDDMIEHYKAEWREWWRKERERRTRG